MALHPQPVVFLPHGGGPWPFVETGMARSEREPLAAYLRALGTLPPAPPTALLVVSAHWECAVPTVMTGAAPPLLYDYSGFPEEAYSITWPAPGHPGVAARVQSLLARAGFQTAADQTRGFDHGTFVPMKLAYPEADVPTVQLSLIRGLDPTTHLALGHALAPLRDEGVRIIGSGLSFHNLRAFYGAEASGAAAQFDQWLVETMARPQAERDARLTRWADAPGARVCHPREEHLMPLLVAAGAAGDDAAELAFTGTLAGHRHSAFHFGAASALPAASA